MSEKNCVMFSGENSSLEILYGNGLESKTGRLGAVIRGAAFEILFSPLRIAASSAFVSS